MGKIQIKEKHILYLQNALYIVFDEYSQFPEEIGDIIGKAIHRSSKILYPVRKEEDRPTIIRIRCDWLCLLTAGLSKRINRCNREQEK